MISRYEYNIQTGNRREIHQIVYRDDAGAVLVLDSGVEPPAGFTEFTGDLSELEVKEGDDKTLG